MAGKKSKKGINEWGDKFLRTWLWLWLPFYAFFDLIHDLGKEKHH